MTTTIPHWVPTLFLGESDDVKESLRRLQILVDHLKNVNPRKFDLREWAYSAVWRNQCPVTLDEVTNPECGTTACAVGHACTIPEFQKLGLALVVSENLCRYELMYFPGDGSEPFENWDVPRNFFRIPQGIAYWLFDSSEYPRSNRSVFDVVARIESYIKQVKEYSNA